MFSLTGQRFRVRGEPARRARSRLWHKQINAKRTRGECACGDDLFGETAGREEATGDISHAPAVVIAAASSGVEGPPAIGATINGTSSCARTNRFDTVDSLVVPWPSF
jgi:hypothetical protein